MEFKIPLLVKGEITITKGWNTWKNMVAESKDKMEEYGISFIFAGSQMDDETKLHVVMKFDSMESLEKFRKDDELTTRRRQAGAIIESGIQVPISSDFMTNFPNTFVVN